MFLSVALMFTTLGVSIKASMAQEVPRISKEELKELLRRPDVKFIDASRLDQMINSYKIEGPAGEDARNFESWAAQYPRDKTFVFYCG